ncbi:hypothetical protein ACTFIY_003154 [Dictyostelium cf. discoideum]
MISRLIKQTTKVNQIRTFCSVTNDPKGDKIRDLLNTALKPSTLNVIDMSGGCGSMYKIEIVSPEFKDKSMVSQHRKVNRILKSVIPSLHGLTLVTKSEE